MINAHSTTHLRYDSAVIMETIEAVSPTGMEIPKHVTFAELTDILAKLFESDVVDCEQVRAALCAYQSNATDWDDFALWDDHTYTRNLIDEGNGKYNLMLICWNNGQASSIHNHAGSHCFMKICDGTLTEELYCKPDEVTEGQKLKPCKVTPLQTDDVAYISDMIGMHRIANASHTVPAVSLHLYSPPYEKCKSYCDVTGKARCSGKISFHSIEGTITPMGKGCQNSLSEGARI